jgi:hypothetical protein
MMGMVLLVMVSLFFLLNGGSWLRCQQQLVHQYYALDEIRSSSSPRVHAVPIPLQPQQLLKKR